MNIDNHVIATGGSAPYSSKAMTHLRQISNVIFLEVSFEEIERRIENFATRGIAKAKDQSFQELYNERQSLYKKYAEMIIDCNKLNQDQIAMYISRLFKNRKEA